MTSIEEPTLNQSEQAHKLMKKIKKDPKLMQQYLQMQKQFQNINANANENLSPREKLLMKRNQLKGTRTSAISKKVIKDKTILSEKAKLEEDSTPEEEIVIFFDQKLQEMRINEINLKIFVNNIEKVSGISYNVNGVKVYFKN